MISIHASRGGSDEWGIIGIDEVKGFQSTLPAGEATIIYDNGIHVLDLFQSTLPAGEATQAPDAVTVEKAISIHASRGGSDVK